MNVTAPKTVALKALPKLMALIQSRKQARWQWKYSAHEHAHRWVLVIEHLDKRITAIERFIEENLDIDGFRAKREMVE